MKVIIFVAVILLLSLMAGCSAGKRATYLAWGTDAKVKCYSMGQLIYDGISNGVVDTRENGEMYFQDKNTRRLVEIHNSSCVVEHI